MYNLQCVVLELQCVSQWVIQLLCTHVIVILSHPIGFPILRQLDSGLGHTYQYWSLLYIIKYSIRYWKCTNTIIIVANRYINKFKPPIYDLCSSAGEVPIYQHPMHNTFSRSGSISGDIMLKYINKVVANSDHTIYLLLDYAPMHRTMEFKLHRTVENVQLHYIPANTTHIHSKNNVFKSYVVYWTIDAFDARHSAPTQ